MKYTVELKKGQAQIDIEIEGKDWESALERAYQTNKGKYSMAGFRKGHVPRKVLEGVYGKSLFTEDALNSSFNKYYYEILDKETDLHPVDEPDVDVTEASENGVKLTALVTLKPTVTLGKYKGLKIKRKEFKVADKDVEAELTKAAEQNARMVKVEGRGIDPGDEATFDFCGSVDGVKFDGGTAENYKLVIGSGRFIPGFEEQMAGMSVGEEKDISVQFPEDYHAENLAGKDAVFAVKVNEIHIKELPAIDDELAKDVSDFETLAEWKQDVKKALEKSCADKEEMTFENEIIEKVNDGVKIDIPAVMIERQTDSFLDEFKMTLSYQGLKLEDYVKYTNTTEEQMREEYRARAEQTVKTRLVMEEIIKQEKLMPTAEEVEEKIKELAEGSGKTAAEYKKTLKSDTVNYIINDIVSKKMLEFLKKENSI